jgi:hypothetical protein
MIEPSEFEQRCHFLTDGESLQGTNVTVHKYEDCFYVLWNNPKRSTDLGRELEPGDLSRFLFGFHLVGKYIEAPTLIFKDRR